MLSILIETFDDGDLLQCNGNMRAGESDKSDIALALS